MDNGSNQEAIFTFNEWNDCVLTEAIRLWGAATQLQMAFGEAGEFVALAGREVQGRAKDEDYVDEIADNIIMMMQMRKIFGREKVDERIAYKIKRLREREEKYIKENKL